MNEKLLVRENKIFNKPGDIFTNPKTNEELILDVVDEFSNSYPAGTLVARRYYRPTAQAATMVENDVFMDNDVQTVPVGYSVGVVFVFDPKRTVLNKNSVPTLSVGQVAALYHSLFPKTFFLKLKELFS